MLDVFSHLSHIPTFPTFSHPAYQSIRVDRLPALSFVEGAVHAVFFVFSPAITMAGFRAGSVSDRSFFFSCLAPSLQ